MLGNRGNSAAETGSKPRIRGRKVGTSFPAGHQDRPYSTPPVAFASASIPAAKTTEDPYVQATLKRSIVELYNTCHRLLSFKVCDRMLVTVPLEPFREYPYPCNVSPPIPPNGNLSRSCHTPRC